MRRQHILTMATMLLSLLLSVPALAQNDRHNDDRHNDDEPWFLPMKVSDYIESDDTWTEDADQYGVYADAPLPEDSILPGDDEPIVQEEISNLIIQTYDGDWYSKQANLWYETASQSDGDEHAWFNFFRAVHYAVTYGDYDYNEADEIRRSALRLLEKHIPDTYSYYCAAYQTLETGQQESYQYAEKAIANLPDQMTFYDYDTWTAYLNLIADSARFTSWMRNYLASGIYSDELLTFTMNELNTLKPNAIYLGNGDATIIPKWLIQEGMGKHRDKLVLCYGFFSNPEYCNHIYRQLGIGQVPEMPEVFQTYDEYDEYIQFVINEIARRTGRELYISKHNGENTYITWLAKGLMVDEGMVYHCTKKKGHYIKTLRHNYEKVLDLNYLLQPLRDNAWETDSKMSISMVYNFLELYHYYKGHHDKRAAELESILVNAIDRTNLDDDSKAYYKENLLDIYE